QDAAGLEVSLPRPLSSPVESIGVPKTLGQQLHQLEREVRVLSNEDVELRLVDLDELGLFERDRRGRPGRVLEERHLAEELLILQDVHRVVADEDRYPSPLDGEHAFAWIAFPENRRPDRIHLALRGILEQAELPRGRGHDRLRESLTQPLT